MSRLSNDPQVVAEAASLIGASLVGSAASTTYSNTGSGLSATTVQGAIDEVAALVPQAPEELPAEHDIDDVVAALVALGFVTVAE